MKELKFTNSLGQSITFGTSRPYIIEEIDGIGASNITVKSSKGYRQNGIYVQKLVEEERIIGVDLIIIGDSKTDLKEKERDIFAKTNPLLEIGEIEYTDDLATYKIQAYSTMIPDFEPMGNSYAKKCTLMFMCPEPDWLSVAPTTIKMVDYTGGLTFPMTFPVTFAERGDGATVEYTGDNPADVIIDFRGPAVNPIITNEDTGVKVEVDHELFAGEKLIVSTNPAKPSVVIIDSTGESDAYDKLIAGSKPTLFNLVYGTNKISFSAASSTGEPECYLTYHDHWSGI